jgi:hypothetical protein
MRKRMGERPAPHAGAAEFTKARKDIDWVKPSGPFG